MVEVLTRTLLAQSAKSEHSAEAEALWQKAESACQAAGGSDCSRTAMAAAAQSMTAGDPVQ